MKSFLKKIRIGLLTTFKYRFKSVGKGFYCGKKLFIRPNTIELGNHIYIGNNAHLSVNKLIIEDYVMLASNVSIVGGDHNFKVVGVPTIFTGRGVQKEVLIKRDAWVGHGAIIVHGVTIGEGAVIAAGSIVTRDVEPYSIVVGAPAKLLKMRFTEEEIVEHKKLLATYKTR